MREVGRLLTREIRLAWSGGGGAAAPAAFFFAAAALAAFAIGADPARLAAAAPGVVTLAFALAAILGFEHLFQADLESGALEQYALGPVSLEGVAAAKILTRALATLAPAALAAPACGLMLGLDVSAALAAAPVLALAGLGLAAAGAPAAALAAGRPRGGLLIAVITPPLLTPTMIFAAGGLRALTEGGDPTAPLAFLAASVLAAFVIGAVGAGAALRMHLE